ncbi:hypothetical protein LTR37_017610 [Vermiconidia calcicola]|uniref:Uncharacterized protein n=1 Tax=Vermiconidia calcicola TaxID=1690605 RepID=A0ACC3MJF4_9PEZI|nr:hypothetical protein LTR37_017610 [Vermiconidia calcicola]
MDSDEPLEATLNAIPSHRHLRAGAEDAALEDGEVKAHVEAQDYFERTSPLLTANDTLQRKKKEGLAHAYIPGRLTERT